MLGGYDEVTFVFAERIVKSDYEFATGYSHVRNGTSFGGKKGWSEGSKAMTRTECVYSILDAVKGVVMTDTVGVFVGSVDAIHGGRHFGVEIGVRHCDSR
jgi:hypothetical protein